MFIYKGPATAAEDMSPEQSKSIMQAWSDWMNGVEENLIDMGTPLANGHALFDDGTDGDGLDLSGYSIIQADSMEHAMEYADSHPFLSDEDGKFSIEIHEMLPVPEM